MYEVARPLAHERLEHVDGRCDQGANVEDVGLMKPDGESVLKKQSPSQWMAVKYLMKGRYTLKREWLQTVTNSGGICIINKFSTITCVLMKEIVLLIQYSG